MSREQRDAEHERSEDRRHEDEDPSCVGAGRLAERGHPVGDGFETGERGAAVGEGAQHDQHGRTHQQAVTRVPDHDPGMLDAVRVQLAESGPDQADDHERPDTEDEEVRGEGEDLPGLPEAAEVPPHHEEHDRHGDVEVVRREGGERRGERVRTGRRLDGDREDVVDDERHSGDLGDPGAEVVPAHDVGTAGLRVHHDDLAVRERHEDEDDQDGGGDREEEGERGDADVLHELVQDLLGAVCRRRDHVRGEDPEGEDLAQLLLLQALGDERRPEHPFLGPVAERLGQYDARNRRARTGEPRRHRHVARLAHGP